MKLSLSSRAECRAHLAYGTRKWKHQNADHRSGRLRSDPTPIRRRQLPRQSSLIKRFSAACVLSAAWLIAQPALADDTVTGTVSQLWVVGALGAAPGNADMRVYFTGNATLCTGAVTTGGWAFLNLTDPNYKAMLALMMTAQVTGKPVTIVSRPATLNSGSYCQIIYAYMSN